jgi:general secretion pathway protein A
LSGFRANIVKSFLLGKGVKPDQIKTQGLGSKNPIESNDTTWGRTMNRRVEIEVFE